MKKKGDRLIFYRLFLVVMLIFFVNVGGVVYKNYGTLNISNGLTGFSVESTVVDSYNNLDLRSRVFLIGQWALLVFVLMYGFIRDRGVLRARDEIGKIHVARIPSKNKTDLDTLYDLLKKNKKLRVSTISKAFKVKNDIALDWCKILESGNLALIDYPAGFGGPVIKLNEEDKKDGEGGEKREGNKKESDGGGDKGDDKGGEKKVKEGGKDEGKKDSGKEKVKGDKNLRVSENLQRRVIETEKRLEEKGKKRGFFSRLFGRKIKKDVKERAEIKKETIKRKESAKRLKEKRVDERKNKRNKNKKR